MKKFYLLTWIVVFIASAGCASAVKNAHSVTAAVPVKKEQTSPASTVKKSDGVIFGKADFRGVLKVEYVKLMIVDENDPDKTYELFFGDRTGELETLVQPHYFFLELPASKYRITSISIPVGTTLATESADIAFTVDNGSLIYLGTLRVTGTDQRIRFGALPIIRPGFDYKVEILNEQDEALREFRNRYPRLDRSIHVQLMENFHIKAY